MSDGQEGKKMTSRKTAPPPTEMGRLGGSQHEVGSEGGSREGDVQADGGHDRAHSPVRLHDGRPVKLRGVPPEVRREGDQDERRDILDPPDRRIDESVHGVDPSLVVEEDREEKDTDDKRGDRLRSNPSGSEAEGRRVGERTFFGGREI